MKRNQDFECDINHMKYQKRHYSISAFNRKTNRFASPHQAPFQRSHVDTALLQELLWPSLCFLLDRVIVECMVPENIHAPPPPMEGFWGLHPHSWKFQWAIFIFSVMNWI